MTIVPWIPNLAKIVCAPWALTFYFHCAIFQLNAQIAHGAGLSRSPILFVEETGEPGENHRPVTSRRQTLSHNVTSGFELTPLLVIGTHCIGSCKSKYNMITITTAP
jgi:hypothetical protein